MVVRHLPLAPGVADDALEVARLLSARAELAEEVAVGHLAVSPRARLEDRVWQRLAPDVQDEVLARVAVDPGSVAARVLRVRESSGFRVSAQGRRIMLASAALVLDDARRLWAGAAAAALSVGVPVAVVLSCWPTEDPTRELIARLVELGESRGGPVVDELRRFSRLPRFVPAVGGLEDVDAGW